MVYYYVADNWPNEMRFLDSDDIVFIVGIANDVLNSREFVDAISMLPCDVVFANKLPNIYYKKMKAIIWHGGDAFQFKNLIFLCEGERYNISEKSFCVVGGRLYCDMR